MVAVYDDVVLPSGELEPIFGGEGIPAGRLNLRFNHSRDKTKGVVLSEGQVLYQELALVNADPLGIGGTVNVGDALLAGEVLISPVNSPVEEQQG